MQKLTAEQNKAIAKLVNENSEHICYRVRKELQDLRSKIAQANLTASIIAGLNVSMATRFNSFNFNSLFGGPEMDLRRLYKKQVKAVILAKEKLNNAAWDCAIAGVWRESFNEYNMNPDWEYAHGVKTRSHVKRALYQALLERV